MASTAEVKAWRRAAEAIACGEAPSSLPLGRCEEDFFLETIRHYAYVGDTLLHIAAASFDLATAKKLVKLGAEVSARNRRGAEPLHYAADGAPGASKSQAAMVKFLIASGADANALDKSGVAPLHRAVRSRCTSAVEALLAAGADARLKNGSGSTPFELATMTTGKSGSGSDAAREAQSEILTLLR